MLPELRSEVSLHFLLRPFDFCCRFSSCSRQPRAWSQHGTALSRLGSRCTGRHLAWTPSAQTSPPLSPTSSLQAATPSRTTLTACESGGVWQAFNVHLVPFPASMVDSTCAICLPACVSRPADHAAGRVQLFQVVSVPTRFWMQHPGLLEGKPPQHRLALVSPLTFMKTFDFILWR